MKTTTLPLVAAALLTLASAPSFAQTALPSGWSLAGNAGLVSDYRFRGISQTNKGPAFQGGFDFTHSSGFYVGNWNSNVDSGFYNGASLEMDLYGGFKGSVDAFSYDVGLLYYYYPESGAGGSYKVDNMEFYIAGGWGPVTLKYSYAFSDFFGVTDTKGAYYVDGTVTYPITKEVSLIGHVGYQGGLKNGARIPELNGSNLYTSVTDFKVGATYDLNGWVLGASWIGTNRSTSLGTASFDSKDIAGNTLVLSVTKSF